MFLTCSISKLQLTFVGASTGARLTTPCLGAHGNDTPTRTRFRPHKARGSRRRADVAVSRRLPLDWFQLVASSGCTATTSGVRTGGDPALRLRDWLQVAPPSFAPLPQVGSGAGNARVIWWVNQDQRVTDNVALAEAARATRDRARGGLLLAVYTGSVRSCETRCALRDLRERLVALGSELLVIPEGGGAALVALLSRLRNEFQIQIDRIVFNHAVNWDGALAERAMVEAVEQANEPALTLQGYWAGNTLLDEGMVQELSAQAGKRNVSFLAVAGTIRQRRTGKEVSIKLEPAPKRLSCPEALCALAADSWRQIGTGMEHGTHRCPSEAEATRTLQAIVRQRNESVTERLARSDHAELSLVLKSALDLGCISVRQVLKRIAEVYQGSYEGYTFSEMMWRSYWAYHMHLKAFGGAGVTYSGKVSVFS